MKLQKAFVGKLSKNSGKQTIVCSLQSVVCSLQFAVCSLQSAVCSLQSAVCSLQSAVCSLQSAVCSLQSAVCSLQSAVCSLQSAVCSLQSAVCSLQSANVRHRFHQDSRAPCHFACTVFQSSYMFLILLSLELGHTFRVFFPQVTTVSIEDIVSIGCIIS